MTYRVVYAPEAEAQLVDLFFYIAAEASPEIAARFTDAIVQQCENLKTFPVRGTIRNDIRPGLRTIGFRRRATIVFNVSSDLVTILGIFYGGQNFEEAFDE
jgi:plasmid stabilization system protein ParE